MDSQDIKDFSDLGQSVFFTYNKTKFAIPPLNRAAMTELLRINSKISDHVKQSNPKPKEPKEGEPEPEEDSEETIKNMDALFGLQQNFIVLGIRKTNAEGQLLPVPEEEVAEWPMRLKHKVILMINDALSTTTTKEGDERPT
jgi:hypothetical protein